MIYYLITIFLGAFGVYFYYKRKKRNNQITKKEIKIDTKKTETKKNPPKKVDKPKQEEITIKNIPVGSPQRIGNQKCLMKSVAGSNLIIEDGKMVQNNSNYNYLHAKGDVGVMGGGKWYYEMTLESNGQILIGWATDKWKAPQNSHVGLGNDSESWGYDGYYGTAWNCGVNKTYGRNYWYNNETIGIGLDLDRKKIEFWRSGISCGVAYENIPKDVYIYPAISMKQYQRVRFNFGESNFIYPQNGYFPLHSNLSEGQKKNLENLFSQYKNEGIKLSDSKEDYGDIIKEEGTLKLIKDLGCKDDNDPLLFVVSWKLNCKNTWQISKNEWMSLPIFGVTDLNNLKTVSAQWKKQAFSSLENLKPLYNYCFDYIRGDRKNISTEECFSIWNILSINEKKWKFWSDWKKFLEIKNKNIISKDEWQQLFTFIQLYPKNFDNYDNASSSSPVFLDEFVDFVTDVSEGSDSDDL